jgi:hypothetical protein
MDCQLVIPVVDRAFGNRAAHSESADHVHERVKPVAVVLPHEIGQPSDGPGVGEIARVSASGLSRVRDLRRSRLRFLESTIHEDKRRAKVGERSRDHFAHLAIAADACEKNG